MKQNVLKRLGQLEERRAAAISAKQSEYNSEAVMEWFRTVLRAFNTEPGPNESYMDALARCLSLRTHELRQLLAIPDEFRRVLDAALARVPESGVAA